MSEKHLDVDKIKYKNRNYDAKALYVYVTKGNRKYIETLRRAMKLPLSEIMNQLIDQHKEESNRRRAAKRVERRSKKSA